MSLTTIRARLAKLVAIREEESARAAARQQVILSLPRNGRDIGDPGPMLELYDNDGAEVATKD